MINVWLNRIGIVLNLLAGFMVAPELIGIQRIRRVESHLKQRTQAAKKHLKKSIHELKWLRWIWPPDFPQFHPPLLLLMAAVISSILVWSLIKQNYYITAAVGVFLYVYSVATGVRHTKLSDFYAEQERYDSVKEAAMANIITWNDVPSPPARKELRTTEVIRRKHLALLTVYPVYVLLVTLISTTLSMPETIMMAMDRVFSFISDKLEGEDRLRSMLVWWGIVLFIVGNLLQLVATF